MLVNRNFFHTTIDLTIAQLKSRYRKTFAGLIWVVLNPLIMFGAQSIAFKHILKLEIPDYYLYLLAGLVPWIFIIMTFQMSTSSIVGSAPLLKSFQINPLVIVMASVFDNLLNFLLAFTLMYIPIQSIYGFPSWSLLLLPIPFLFLIIGVTSISITLSILNVFYRDISYVVNFLTGVLFFVTPVFFTADMILPGYEWLLNFHIPYLFIDVFRVCIYNFTLESFYLALGKSALASLLVTALAAWVWNRKRNELYLRL